MDVQISVEIFLKIINATPQTIDPSPQQVLWYLLRKGCSFKGTNIELGQVHLLNQVDIDLFRQATPNSVKFLSHVSIQFTYYLMNFP